MKTSQAEIGDALSYHLYVESYNVDLIDGESEIMRIRSMRKCPKREAGWLLMDNRLQSIKNKRERFYCVIA